MSNDAGYLIEQRPHALVFLYEQQLLVACKACRKSIGIFSATPPKAPRSRVTTTITAVPFSAA